MSSFQPQTARQPDSLSLSAESLVNKERASLLTEFLLKIQPIDPTESLNKRYPERQTDLPVTRVAPSPTGFMHIGGIYMALINNLYAKQRDGTFFLRVEDTDQQRLVAGAHSGIVRALTQFNIAADEGPASFDSQISESGEYGPYVQSQRLSIYWTSAIELVKRGKAYPCFATSEDLENCRIDQQKQGLPPGYYGKWALWRDADLGRISESFEKGIPFVIRHRSENEPGSVCKWKDLVKGETSHGANINDIIIIKTDRFPTYHFAHVVDDHYMHTTHVIRGEEWVSSVPVHLELFSAFGWSAPFYGHCPLIQKIEIKNEVDPETGRAVQITSRRKISKRHDPEASIDHYLREGYCREAITDYLLNIANSDFEPWRTAYPTAPWTEFPLHMDNFGSGALLDSKKLENINRDWLAKMPVERLFNSALEWARQYAPEIAANLDNDHEYSRKVLDAERSSKRVHTWKEMEPQFGPFFENYFNALPIPALPGRVSSQHAGAFLTSIIENGIVTTSQEDWFGQMRKLASELGFAPDSKQFKAAPEKFFGNIGDLMMVVRHALWRSDRSPDLFEVQGVLGEKNTISRLMTHRNIVSAEHQ